LKLRSAAIIILILLADQALKIYIKTNYTWGEEHNMAGNWAKLHFIENSGMAWGWKIFGGPTGKLILTIFRLLACVFGVYYLNKIIKQQMHKGFIICVALILAGAIGNLIDSMFYGLIFDKGYVWDATTKEYVAYYGEVAKFSSKGYAGLFQGSVVDMLHFPLFKGQWPNWLAQWFGKDFLFFSPVFNIADASISVGVIAILLFQNKFFKKAKQEKHPTVITNSTVTDAAQIS
jgi:signal peptidase II